MSFSVVDCLFHISIIYLGFTSYIFCLYGHGFLIYCQINRVSLRLFNYQIHAIRTLFEIKWR